MAKERGVGGADPGDPGSKVPGVILRRLVRAEKAASEQLRAARQRAEGTVEAARADARAILEHTRKRAEEEARRLVDDARSAETENAVEGRTIAELSDPDTLRNRARDNFPDAVSLLVHWVTDPS